MTEGNLLFIKRVFFNLQICLNMLVGTVVFTIRPLWYFAIFAKNGFATVGVVPPGPTLSTIWFGLNTKRLDIEKK